jgi:putative NIF3 family GTP cyclohydrolase 1 type 2
MAVETKRTGSTVAPGILGLLAIAAIGISLQMPGVSAEPLSTKESDSVTARQIVERIKRHVTCSWQERTVDTFKAGDPNAPVTGIAVTFMATYDVLRRAAKQGCNFVITHEPTFYHGRDDTSQLEPDPIIEAKRKFIRDNNLVVWRFHDHIHRIEPDGIVAGMIDLFEWKSLRKQTEELCFELSQPVTLRQFAEDLKKKFAHSVIRVIGDPGLEFTKFGLAVGAPGSLRQMKMLQRDDVEVLVAGESREWETVEYVRDAKDMGKKKAVILLGHAISEEAGMRYCGQWLRSFVKDVPVRFVPAGDPFWTP